MTIGVIMEEAMQKHWHDTVYADDSDKKQIIMNTDQKEAISNHFLH